jgi:hypothetical protein
MGIPVDLGSLIIGMAIGAFISTSVIKGWFDFGGDDA